MNITINIQSLYILILVLIQWRAKPDDHKFGQTETPVCKITRTVLKKNYVSQKHLNE